MFFAFIFGLEKEAVMLRLSSLPAALISILGLTALALAADDPLMKQAQGLFFL